VQPQTVYIPLPVVAVYDDTATNERWGSGPMIAGDRVLLMGDQGYLTQLPLDPKKVNPTFGTAAGTGLAPFNIRAYAGLRAIRDVASVYGEGVSSAPAVGSGFVAVCTRRGLTVYNAPSVVIADANRVIEASGNSTALATADAVLKHRMDISEFPIPTDPSFANTSVGTPLVARPIVVETKLLSRPAKVIKLSRGSSLTTYFTSAEAGPGPEAGAGRREFTEFAEESYLAADTGNDRCVEFNPAGKVVWEARDFQDPTGILPAGESLKLSAPMDVQRWVDIETVNNRRIYVIHTLIADTGNTRVIELVDKVQYQNGYYGPDSFPVISGQVGADGTPIRWYHVLVWSSQTNAQGLRLRYRTAQRIYWPNGAGGTIPVGNVNPPDLVGRYLPPEQYVSYTMASVSGQQVRYPFPPAGTTYSEFLKSYALTTPRNPDSMRIDERRPDVRGGGDSIVFLRGRYYAAPSGMGSMAAAAPIRERKTDASGNPITTGDSYRLSQGVIDPNLPTITEIWDELTSGGAAASENRVHTLAGIQSVQRTIRADVKFAPWTYTGNSPIRSMYRQYFLIADTDGVWELQLLAGAPATINPARLAWAFTNEDYAYVTGAGSGDPTKIYLGTELAGRRLNALSARRIPNGLVLITSRTPISEPVAGRTDAVSAQFRQRYLGPDVFLLQPLDYLTARERPGNSPYNRRDLVDSGGNPLHGWRPDAWVQATAGGSIPSKLKGTPSIRWRAAEQVDSKSSPFRASQTGGIGGSPVELTGTYLPVQPSFADLVY